jgi:predicted DNA-binding antitoxin AbrB/MazE fold protein
MAMSIDATFENGVFVPVQKPTLADHERVRLTVEVIAPARRGTATIRLPRGARILLDPNLAKEIAQSAEFHPNGD